VFARSGHRAFASGGGILCRHRCHALFNFFVAVAKLQRSWIGCSQQIRGHEPCARVRKGQKLKRGVVRGCDRRPRRSRHSLEQLLLGQRKVRPTRARATRPRRDRRPKRISWNAVGLSSVPPKANPLSHRNFHRASWSTTVRDHLLTSIVRFLAGSPRRNTLHRTS
jgi:hypothetical protein